jgi:hypothetical protein
MISGSVKILIFHENRCQDSQAPQFYKSLNRLHPPALDGVPPGPGLIRKPL